MKTNAELTQEYLDIMKSMGGDPSGRKEAADYMAHSTAIVHHQHVACSCLPRLFNVKTRVAMTWCAETAHVILTKVMKRYLEDPAYREVFDFDPRLVDLILIPRRYQAMLPFARVDTFMNEDDYTFKFCEFNGDGSSGMNENREITLSVVRTNAMKEFVQRYNIEACELFNSWVNEFISIYDTFENKVKAPRFAIVDYLENGVVDEFHIFAKLFKHAGYDCSVADVRELTYTDGVLRDKDGLRVDAIWRRCVTNDVIEFWDDSQQMIQAVRDGKVALIGSFAGHIVHDKQIFRALFDERTRAFLTQGECKFIDETVPFTSFLDEQYVNLDDIKANKDAWIVKPTDGYGAKDVYAGCAVTQDEWVEIIDKYANSAFGFPFIVQAYCMPFKTLTMPPDFGIEDKTDEDVPFEPKPYNNLNGLYLYNGKFQGVFSRLGPLPTISKDKQGITSATIWVKDE